MTYATKNAEILALFTATGKDLPTEDSNMGQAVQILTTICDSQSHTVPEMESFEEGVFAGSETAKEDNEFASSEIFEALESIESHLGESDFTLEFDGNEYRLINESSIWEIYRDEIQNIVEDCYSDVIKPDKIPDFIAFSIDWEQTAQNAYADGYGHTFSGYDGSEEEAAGYYIFRTN